MAVCSTVACTMRDGDCDILAKGSNPYSVEETPEGDVRGIFGFAVLLHGYLQGRISPCRCEICAICRLPKS